jgi:hypothetical protein
MSKQSTPENQHLNGSPIQSINIRIEWFLWAKCEFVRIGIDGLLYRPVGPMELTAHSADWG